LERLERLDRLFGFGSIGHNIEIHLVVARRLCIFAQGALGFGEAKNGSYIGGIGGGSILVPEQGSLIIACSKVKAAHLRVLPGASRIRNLRFAFLGAGGAAGRA